MGREASRRPFPFTPTRQRSLGSTQVIAFSGLALRWPPKFHHRLALVAPALKMFVPGRPWEALGGPGRPQEALGGPRRPWEALGGPGRSWDRYWQMLEVLGGTSRCWGILRDTGRGTGRC